MCEFVSWKEYEGKNYFLTNANLDTKEGKALLKDEYRADIEGHGAIEHYYPELKGKGVKKECSNFSTPANFPKEIVKALKLGKLTRIGITLDILNKTGLKKYNETIVSARQKCDETIATALKKYNEIEAPARKKYDEIEAPAREKCDETTAPARQKRNETIVSAFSAIVKYKKYRRTKWK